jgi:hypothetical protein
MAMVEQTSLLVARNQKKRKGLDSTIPFKGTPPIT